MKPISTLAVASLILAAAACSSSSSDQTANGADSTAAATPATAEVQPVSIVTWKEVGVRDTPSEKGKYVTSIYLGEHIVATGDTASEKAGSKRNHYHKVTLTDGKTGWVRDEFIAIDVYPAVVLNESQIMKRPDPATVTDKSFKIGDFVTVKKKDGDYIEVTGKSLGDKWYTTGYVRADNLAYAEVEVQYATLKLRAAEETKENIKNALLGQLNDATLFGTSILYNYDNAEEGDGYEEGGDGDPGYGIPPFELEPPTEGLLGYYQLNNSEVTDGSGLGNDGTKHGNVGIAHDVAGFTEGAASFDGQSWISIPASSDKVVLPFTVVAYFQVANPDARDQCAVSRGRSKDGTGFNFGYTQDENNNSIVYFGVVGSRPFGVTLQKRAVADEWIYLAASIDRTGMKLYLNGDLVDELPLSPDEANIIEASLANSNEPLEIGRELQSLDRYFRGAIDNVAVWNRVLSADEIAGMAR